jgi:hypothetical protein
MRGGQARPGPVFVQEVDEAPVGQLAHGQVGDAPKRCLVIGRAGEDLAGAREDVELALAVERFRSRRPLGGEQALALLARVAALAHVEQVPLDVERPGIVVADGHRLVVHPNDPAVARQHPVLAVERPGARRSGGDLGRDTLAILLVHELEEEVRLREPFVR